jgi:hypothetical protein
LPPDLKFSYEYGPSAKYFIDKTDALKHTSACAAHGVVFTGLWERHMPIFDVDKLNYTTALARILVAWGSNTNPKFNNTLLRVPMALLVPNT